MSAEKLKNILEIIPEGRSMSNGYLLHFGDDFYLIDPGMTVNTVSQAAQVKLIIGTHAHFDHIAYLDDWRSYTKSPYYLHQDDEIYLSDPTYNASTLFGQSKTYAAADKYLSNDEIIPLAANYYLELFHTPGHTPGSVCYFLCRDENNQKYYDAMFSGDTLFYNSIGRTDFKGGNYQTILESLEKIKKLAGKIPSDLPIFPGHGPSTTFAAELKNNPWLAASNDIGINGLVD